jgi:hypothetical protein
LLADEGSARQRAEEFDRQVVRMLKDLRLPPPKELFQSVREHLQERSNSLRAQVNVQKILRFKPQGTEALIAVGPGIDKGPTETHFTFPSQARLSFAITVREQDGGSRLLSHRYHLEFPPGRGLRFVRFDLNPKVHENPLLEPRSHLHPGFPELRLPFPVLAPLDLLDRIFFVVEPAFAR